MGLQWGGPPYAFPYGDQSHVMYYPGPSYYYPGFQTTYGYNGHMGYPAAVQYVNPPGRMHAPPLGRLTLSGATPHRCDQAGRCSRRLWLAANGQARSR